MLRRYSVFCFAAAACALLVGAAYAQTKIVTSSGPDKVQEAPPKKILVVAVVTDAITRASYEDVIAGELSLRGATAVASHVSFSELPKERAPFEAKILADGFDAVLIGRLVSKDDKIKTTEGYQSYATTYQGMDYWGGYWYTYQEVFVPGYLEKETKVRVRSDLWRIARSSAAASRIAWTGTSETMNPRTAAPPSPRRSRRRS